MFFFINNFVNKVYKKIFTNEGVHERFNVNNVKSFIFEYILEKSIKIEDYKGFKKYNSIELYQLENGLNNNLYVCRKVNLNLILDFIRQSVDFDFEINEKAGDVYLRVFLTKQGIINYLESMYFTGGLYILLQDGVPITDSLFDNVKKNVDFYKLTFMGAGPIDISTLLSFGDLLKIANSLDYTVYIETISNNLSFRVVKKLKKPEKENIEKLELA